jgi:hypothetical protein
MSMIYISELFSILPCYYLRACKTVFYVGSSLSGEQMLRYIIKCLLTKRFHKSFSTFMVINFSI